MKRTPLKDFVKRNGLTQVKLAELMGRTQGAVNQMLNSDKRTIFVIEDGDSVRFEEVKPIEKTVA